MADPIRGFFEWPGDRRMRRTLPTTAHLPIRQGSLQQSIEIISRHELRVWFEPNWADARILAARFPHCLICSIPVESDTINRTRVPGWRKRREGGVL